MSAEVKKEIELEIAYVLFVDIVGYSKLLIDQQRRSLELLNQIVRGTEQFRKADANHRLITIPTGDGMALVFYNTPEAPVECALEISRAVKEHPELRLRMGVHSGPVSGVVDVSGRANIAGAGINIAQRVMDCGDAEHILLSKHVAEDLEQLGHWKKHLHNLGEAEVKHGAHVSVVNLYTEELGNPEVPQKFLQARHKAAAVPVAAETPRTNRSWIIAAAAIIVAALALGGFLLSRRSAPVASRSAPSAIPVATPATAPVTAPTAVPEKSIAVLPFENLSEEKANAFFTDGVQDEILTDLAKIADLKVISRTSVMPYKTGTARNLREIAQQLGVAHLVEGSVQRVSNRVRVNAQLIDARNDAHLWAQTYDRDLADVFAIQSEIAKAIADQLQAKLSPAEKNAIEQRPTSDVAAFELYSRAKDLILNTGFSAIRAQNLRQGIELLNAALARDPSFFAAQYQLVLAQDNLYTLAIDRTPQRLALAEKALEALSRLQPNAGETHLARATHFYTAYRDYDRALAELEVARSTMPNAPRIYELTGFMARRRGAHEDGIRNLQHAAELDPRNFFTLQQLAISYELVRRYSEQLATIDRALSIRPDDPETKAARGLVLLDWKADTRPLHVAVDEIRAKQPEVVKSVADLWFFCALAEHDAGSAELALTALGDAEFGDNQTQLNAAFGRALLARMIKDESKAHAAFAAMRPQQEKIVQEQSDFGPAVCTLALIDAGLGRKEEALREIRRAVELVPVEKDALNGADMIQYSGIVAAWVGEKDLALQNLTKAAQLPGFLSYGRLKLLPWYDPLRGDPRFEKIVDSLAPK
ncbi:MAG: adenylate/guanylate cyclase domain-containing protein [Chthoniobacterales bacterium]